MLLTLGIAPSTLTITAGPAELVSARTARAVPRQTRLFVAILLLHCGAIQALATIPNAAILQIRTASKIHAQTWERWSYRERLCIIL